MTGNPRADDVVTIAIPFYAGTGYLRMAIESVLAQNHGGWRLLVCDDAPGATDARAIVDSFADERIEYRRNARNFGMVRNWNHCLDSARTDLVTLLHGDDRLGLGYVRTMLALAGSHPDAVAFYCNARIIDRRGRPSFSLADAVKGAFAPRGREPAVLRGESAVRALMAGNFIMCPTLCLRMSRLGERRFSIDWHQVQDLEITTRLLIDGETLVGSPEVAYDYRRHGESATSLQSESLLRFDEELRLFSLIGDRAEAVGWHGAARVARRKAIVKLHLVYRALRDLGTLRGGAALQKLRFLLERW